MYGQDRFARCDWQRQRRGSGSGVTTGSGGVTGTGGTGSVDVAACATGVHATRMPLKRLTPNQYANAVRDLFNGKIQPSTRFPPQSAPSVTGFSTEPDSNAVDQFAAEQILFAAEDAALQVPAALAQLLPCASSGGASCADTFIRTCSASAAYRRPLDADEVTNLTKQFSDAQTAGFSFAEAIAVVADVLLQSPQFLYLPEIGVGTDEVRPLTQHELATRLAFLLWDSPPGDRAADRGRQRRARQRSNRLQPRPGGCWRAIARTSACSASSGSGRRCRR